MQNPYEAPGGLPSAGEGAPRQLWWGVRACSWYCVVLHCLVIAMSWTVMNVERGAGVLERGIRADLVRHGDAVIATGGIVCSMGYIALWVMVRRGVRVTVLLIDTFLWIVHFVVSLPGVR